MADCECLPGCPFFNDQMADMPSTAELVKANYCSGPRADNTPCARHMIFLVRGSDEVPVDLFPSDVARAESVLAGRE